MRKRDKNFYTEVVVVTVVSLIAANAWIRVMIEAVSQYYNNSITVMLFIATMLTLLAVLILHHLYAEKSDEEEQE